jgi:class 3 adenylate cyclase
MRFHQLAGLIPLRSRVNAPPIMQVWLEQSAGDPIPLTGPVSFGRTASNQIVLTNEKVSRRHALIHPQGENEFWLVDLGSRNGTYVNQRRLSQPIRLRDGDQIQLGPFVFVFRQVSSAPQVRGPEKEQSTLLTLMDVRALACWLLVADVENSTDLANALPADEVAVLVGRWLLNCKHIIESNGGTLNKYLGDGFLAYWRAAEVGLDGIASALTALRHLQTTQPPQFRFVLHRGEVTCGGVASLGEESLSGPAVNFVFRMEKVAGSLGRPVLFSEPAAVALTSKLPATSLGEHPVPSFDGRHHFFGL